MENYLASQYRFSPFLVLFPPKKNFNNEELLPKSVYVEADTKTEDVRNCHGIKLFPNEEVLDVQRKHKITLLFPFFLNGIFVVIASLSIIMLFNSGSANAFLWAMLSVVGLFFSFIQIFATYTFLYWYYQFYIITNKRLIHVCFFRIGGFHLDEVFHEQTNPLEIDSRPQSFILDLLGIEDIYVYFSRFERPEPFVFRSPKDHVKIEEILEDHSLRIMEG